MCVPEDSSLIYNFWQKNKQNEFVQDVLDKDPKYLDRVKKYSYKNKKYHDYINKILDNKASLCAFELFYLKTKIITNVGSFYFKSNNNNDFKAISSTAAHSSLSIDDKNNLDLTGQRQISHLEIKKNERVLDFSDFQKQNITFDIAKLQEAYNQIVQTKKFDDGGGIAHFGAISLTQIPGDPDSIKGNKARGAFWTKPDQTGKEVVRDQMIDEAIELDTNQLSSLKESLKKFRDSSKEKLYIKKLRIYLKLLLIYCLVERLLHVLMGEWNLVKEH